MAHHFNCKCPERKKPVQDRDWVVTEYRWNSGAFTSGNGEPSDYSQVHCLKCGCTGRSKANYIGRLKHMDFYEMLKSLYKNREEVK